MPRKRDVRRIGSRHENGISGPELRLIRRAIKFLRRHGGGVHVTVHPPSLSEHERHEVFDAVKGRAATYQGRAGMNRVYWLSISETVTENGYSPHLHLICVFPNSAWAQKFTAMLNGSEAFKKRFGEKAVHAVEIADAEHWDRLGGDEDHYFTAEATIQAWHGAARSFPKSENKLTGKASFPYAGDRVGASEDLRDVLIRNGQATPWTRRNAKRAAPSTDARVVAPIAPKPVLRIVADNALAPGELQLSLLPEKPVARLRDFAHGVMPRAVAHEVEARRKWLGLTQEQLADAIGISRPQLTNGLQGNFGLSEWVAARLRDFLLRGERLAAA
jgi:hypothetical protein